MTIADEIKKDTQVCFKRVYMKRRLITPVAGVYYEADWVDISDYVLDVSTITWNIDDIELNEFTQGDFTLTLNNMNHKFSPETNVDSLFYGYLTRHKTKIKITAGYYDIETATYYSYDIGVGFILGDEINVQSDSTITIHCLAPSMVFDENPADDVNEGFLPGGGVDWYDTQLVSFVVGKVYDLQKGADYVFHPFLEGSDITPGSDIVADLYNFSDWTCREALTKMAQVSNSCFYIGADWRLKFISRTAGALSSFTFSNTGADVNIYAAYDYCDGLKKTYNRVAWYQTDPPVYAEETWAVGDTSSTWKNGRRPYTIDNRLVTSGVTRLAICTTLLAEYQNPKEEISLTVKFVPQLNLLDRVTVNYYGVPAKFPPTYCGKSFWGKGLWHNLIGGIYFHNVDMKIIRLEHNVMEFTSDVTLRTI